MGTTQYFPVLGSQGLGLLWGWGIAEQTEGEVTWLSAWGRAQHAKGSIDSDMFRKGQLRRHRRPGTLLWLTVFCFSPGTGSTCGWPPGR